MGEKSGGALIDHQCWFKLPKLKNVVISDISRYIIFVTQLSSIKVPNSKSPLPHTSSSTLTHAEIENIVGGGFHFVQLSL